MDASFEITADERRHLLANGRCSARDPEHDPLPVLLLCAASGTPAWLLAELDPDDADLAFGLIDPGDGFPTLGTVRLSALAALAARGVAVARDPGFVPGATLSVLVIAAYRQGRV